MSYPTTQSPQEPGMDTLGLFCVFQVHRQGWRFLLVTTHSKEQSGHEATGGSLLLLSLMNTWKASCLKWAQIISEGSPEGGLLVKCVVVAGLRLRQL